MIQTTVVGSYPVPAWLRVYNSRESLRDAMLVVLKTQELAGIDVVADGELDRWVINHPETNGMIDYLNPQGRPCRSRCFPRRSRVERFRV
jgi:5-methyltetrahydropteroyltriglutamate--homocysteine methyltransferase